MTKNLYSYFFTIVYIFDFDEWLQKIITRSYVKRMRDISSNRAQLIRFFFLLISTALTAVW